MIFEQPDFLCTTFSKSKKINGSKIQKGDIEFLLKEAKWYQLNYSYAAGMIDKVFNDYKTYSNKSKGLVNNTKKNFSLKAMHEKFGKIMDKYIKLPEFVSLKLPEIKKL